MYRAVVSPTQQHEVRERRGSTLRPVMDVVTLAKTHATSREAAAAVAVLEGAAQSRRDRPRTGANFDNPSVGVVSHDHPARVTRQALRRSSWNARAILERLIVQSPRCLRGLPHRRGRRPGSARLERPDRARDAGPPRRAAPGHQPAAAPSSAGQLLASGRAGVDIELPERRPRLSPAGHPSRESVGHVPSRYRPRLDTRAASGWRVVGPRHAPRPCGPCDANRGRSAQRARPCRRGRPPATVPLFRAWPHG